MNAHGLISNCHYNSDLLSLFDLDLIAISEHWLHDYDLFEFIAVPSPCEEDNVYCVPRLIRGHGGVALGWRVTLDERVSSVPIISSSRMVGVEINLPHGSLFVISVYLPSRSGCTDIFREALDATISLLAPDSDVIIMGDFNADLGRYGGPMSRTEVKSQQHCQLS